MLHKNVFLNKNLLESQRCMCYDKKLEEKTLPLLVWWMFS